MGDERQERTGDDNLVEVTGDPLTPAAASEGGEDSGNGAEAASTAGDAEGHGLPDEVEYPLRAGSGLPPRLESWRKRSATGAMLTGFAFGLREVLEPERHEPAIVLETSGVPPEDLPVEVDLDSGPPRQSVVKVRRWLLSDPSDPPADAGAPGTEQGAIAEPDAGDDQAVPASRSTEIRGRDPRLEHRPRRFFRAGRR